MIEQTIKLDGTGLLWRLATFYGPLHERYTRSYGTDICEYTRAVLRGLAAVMLIMASSGIVAACIADAGAYWLVTLTTGAEINFENVRAVFGTVLVLGALLGVAVVGIIELHKKADSCFGRKLIEPREPSAIKEMYDAWKNKYCYKVKFKD